MTITEQLSKIDLKTMLFAKANHLVGPGVQCGQAIRFTTGLIQFRDPEVEHFHLSSRRIESVQDRKWMDRDSVLRPCHEGCKYAGDSKRRPRAPHARSAASRGDPAQHAAA